MRTVRPACQSLLHCPTISVAGILFEEGNQCQPIVRAILTVQQAKALDLLFCEICIESIVPILLHLRWEGPDQPCHVDDAAAVCQISADV